MRLLFHRLDFRPAHSFLSGSTLFGVALSGLLLGLLCMLSAAQITNTKGLTVVGNGSTTQNTQMLIDATQFASGTDMCGAITAACNQLGATSYPLGVTIDARGFTGNQVCAATNITTMLYQCAQGSSNGATGGKLLLGEVNLYADGPSSPNNYQDNLGSGVGTPALIIPNNFWGIEGVSRGSNTATSAQTNPGTWLSVCTGSGTPVGTGPGELPPASGSPSCTTVFPTRSFVISSISFSGTTMTITPSGTLPPLYPNELIMIRGSSATGDNGTFALQTITPSVTVKNATAATRSGPSGCGTAYLATPILGFGPGGGKAYNSHDTSCQNAQGKDVCPSFGLHIQNLGFNCQGLDGCMGWQNLYAQEESGAGPFIIDNFSFVGLDSHGNNAQNFGPIHDAEIYTGAGNTNCTAGTTGAYIGGIAMRGFDHWTINTPAATNTYTSTVCTSTPNVALMLDAEDTETSQGHCENFGDCVLVGANNPNASGIHVTGISEAKPATNDVEISANNSITDFEIENVQTYAGNGTPTVKDDINGITLNNKYLSLYSWSKNSTFTNLVTTDTEIPNRFPSGVATGVTGNTDLAGQCTLGSSCGGGTSKYTFNGSYSSTFPPICTCTDVSSLTFHGCALTVTGGVGGGITFSGNGTDKIDYTCMIRQ